MFQGAALGYELLAHVFAHLDILETDYFGLQYTDEKSVTRWIDQHKSIKKQTCKQRGQYLPNSSPGLLSSQLRGDHYISIMRFISLVDQIIATV